MEINSMIVSAISSKEICLEHKNQPGNSRQDNVYDPYPKSRGKHKRSIRGGHYKTKEVSRSSPAHPQVIQHGHGGYNGLYHEDHTDQHHRGGIVNGRQKQINKQNVLGSEDRVSQ